MVDDPRYAPETTDVRILSPKSFSLANKAVFQESGVAVASPQISYESVLKNSGAIVPARDQIEQEIR